MFIWDFAEPFDYFDLDKQTKQTRVLVQRENVRLHEDKRLV
jgi:hypothetical protein